MAKQNEVTLNHESASNSEKEAKDVAGLMATLGLGVFVIWFIYHVGMTTFYDLKSEDGRESAGQYGDMFGGLNAVFSGLAFAGVLAGMWMQNRQMAATQKDLASQIRAANKQALAAGKANKLQNLSLKLLTSQRYCDFLVQTRERELLFIEQHFTKVFTTARQVRSEDLSGLRKLQGHAEAAFVKFKRDNGNAYHAGLANYVGALKRLVACEEEMANAYFLTKNLKRELEQFEED